MKASLPVSHQSVLVERLSPSGSAYMQRRSGMHVVVISIGGSSFSKEMYVNSAWRMYKFDYRIRALSQAPRVVMGNKSVVVLVGLFAQKNERGISSCLSEALIQMNRRLKTAPGPQKPGKTRARQLTTAKLEET